MTTTGDSRLGGYISWLWRLGLHFTVLAGCFLVRPIFPACRPAAFSLSSHGLSLVGPREPAPVSPPPCKDSRQVFFPGTPFNPQHL